MFQTKKNRFSVYFPGEREPSKDDREVAYNDAFRNYKNFYFSTIKESMCRHDDPPGLQELSRCTFRNSIKDEATDQLAQLLGQELPITYDRKLNYKIGTRTSEAEDLAQAYKYHHFYLRAVRKFYHSRLVKKDYKYRVLACRDGESEKMTSSQVPLLPLLRTYYRKEFLVSSGSSSSSDTFIDPNQVCPSLRWQMLNEANSEWSHWPANLIDQNFFIELANFQLRDSFNEKKDHQQIGVCLGEFAKQVRLDKQLEPFQNSPYIGKKEQRAICKHIVQQFELEGEAQRRETTSSPKPETALPETFPLGMSAFQETSSVEVEEALSPKQTVIIARTPSHFGSTSMNYYGNDTFLNVSFVLIFGGYIIFKIYEFFGLKKYTKPTSVKDCLFKLAEKKKEATFQKHFMVLKPLE